VTGINFVKLPMPRIPRRGGGKRAHRSSNDNVWIRFVHLEDNVAASSTLEENLVDDTDWAITAGHMKATVLTVRYDWTIASSGTEAFGMFGIRVVDEDALTAGANCLSIANVVDEDWLGFVPWGSSTTDRQQITGVVRAKRKITTGMNLQLAIRNNGLGAMQFTGITSVLLKVG